MRLTYRAEDLIRCEAALRAQDTPTGPSYIAIAVAADLTLRWQKQLGKSAGQ